MDTKDSEHTLWDSTTDRLFDNFVDAFIEGRNAIGKPISRSLAETICRKILLDEK